MKAFVLKEPGVVGYEQVPEPVLTPYGAILKPVAVAPCSSDVHTVFGGGSRKAPNLVLGHECVARVLEVGEYGHQMSTVRQRLALRWLHTESIQALEPVHSLQHPALLIQMPS